MTSKRCFFKLMKEDFRHKIWMLALSILGNLLAIPVAYFLYGSSVPYYHLTDNRAGQLVQTGQRISSFFREGICITAGIIAIVGALIVGVAGFRFVFHRNMVDTYHSMPVKRTTLFGIGWLNGFLIWFIPFFLSLFLTMSFGAARLSGIIRELDSIPDKEEYVNNVLIAMRSFSVWKTGFATAGILIIAYLLVYHLTLAAAMLCGNVLNTLVLTGVFGTGTVGLYLLNLLFQEIFYDTYCYGAGDELVMRALYGSPLASAIYLLYRWTQNSYGEMLEAGTVVWNLLIALALGGLALFFYSRRPSELAENGVKNPPVRFLVQTVVTFAAGMGGWLMFYGITSDMMGAEEGARLAWSIFGAILCGVLAFGIMDILYKMEFRAFLSHKLRMLVTMAGVLVLCFFFQMDWSGYDTRLPAKEDIREMSFYTYAYNNSQTYGDILKQTARWSYKDVDVIYDFLENAVAYYRTDSHPADVDINNTKGINVAVKVMLKNGKDYYREYNIYDYTNNESLFEMLVSQEYMDTFYKISEEAMQNVTYVSFRRYSYGENLEKGKGISQEVINSICNAYNQDVAEHPELFIRDDSRCIARIVMEGTSYLGRKTLAVYEEMTHTREALRENHLEEWADMPKASEIEAINLRLGCTVSEAVEKHLDPVELAREEFGVYQDGEPAGEEAVNEAMVETADTIVFEDGYYTESYYDYGDGGTLQITVTDPAEIEELLQLSSYERGGSSVFFSRQNYCSGLEAVTTDGKRDYMEIPLGALPEKYILRFADAVDGYVQ